MWGVGGAQVEGGGGVVACAGDNGSIYVYNGKKLMTGDSSALLTTMEGKHHGPVYCLDLNHFQVGHNYHVYMVSGGQTTVSRFI